MEAFGGEGWLRLRWEVGDEEVVVLMDLRCGGGGWRLSFVDDEGGNLEEFFLGGDGRDSGMTAMLRARRSRILGPLPCLPSATALVGGDVETMLRGRSFDPAGGG